MTHCERFIRLCVDCFVTSDVRLTGRYGIHADSRTVLLHLDIGAPDYFAPLVGVIDNELPKVGAGHRLWNASYIGQSRHELGIGKASINFAVELVDDLGRRVLGRD